MCVCFYALRLRDSELPASVLRRFRRSHFIGPANSPSDAPAPASCRRFGPGRSSRPQCKVTMARPGMQASGRLFPAARCEKDASDGNPARRVGTARRTCRRRAGGRGGFPRREAAGGWEDGEGCACIAGASPAIPPHSFPRILSMTQFTGVALTLSQVQIACFCRCSTTL